MTCVTYVVEHLGGPDDAAGRDAVLVADEAGDLTKGVATVGVARQYTGTAGRIEHAQVAVYLVYAGPGGHGFIDRELYLPKAWADDPDRCAAVGVPADVEFATKPALATAMVDRVLDAGVAVGWFVADEVYGNDPALRAFCHTKGLGYVLAVARDHRITTGIGVRRAVDLALRPNLAWQRISADHGAKGHRYYQWALIDLADGDRDREGHGGHHALLIRRSRSGELAFYRTWTSRPVPLAALVRVAARRWAIEEAFQAGKGLVGLDAHQVRRWTSWRRWTVLAMLAHAFLTVTAAPTSHLDHNPGEPVKPGRLTCGEIQHLLAALVLRPVRDLTHVLAWSLYRRTSAARARASHYIRQATTLT